MQPATIPTKVLRGMYESNEIQLAKRDHDCICYNCNGNTNFEFEKRQNGGSKRNEIDKKIKKRQKGKGVEVGIK